MLTVKHKGRVKQSDKNENFERRGCEEREKYIYCGETDIKFCCYEDSHRLSSRLSGKGRLDRNESVEK